jgi:hypothetical protein
MKDEAKESRVLGHIQKLVSEEHQLFGKTSLSKDQSKRLTNIQVELDQCWDLLRQRRALRETGHKPSEAHVRPADVVKNYEG